MTKIGIIFAMEEELQELKNIIQINNEYKIFDCTFYEGTLKESQLVLAEAGIGKVNAARCCQILIDNMEVDYIFNIGVAGGVSTGIKVGDIVLGEKLVQHDFDITAFQHEKGYIPNVGKYIFSDEYLLKTAKETDAGVPTHKGVIASGDIFCYETDMAKKIAKKFQALCVEMEGASIAQVCYLSHIPFLVIRSISDSVCEENNQKTYENSLKESAKIVAKYLKNIIEKLQ